MALTFDLSVAQLYSFEVVRVEDTNEAAVSQVWRVPVSGGWQYLNQTDLPVEDLEGFTLGPEENYALFYDDATAKGHTVTDTTNLRDL